jgi:hypothetical protein
MQAEALLQPAMKKKNEVIYLSELFFLTGKFLLFSEVLMGRIKPTNTNQTNQY